MDILLIILGVTILSFGFYYLDAKHNYRFIDWMNGRCNNPLESANTQASSQDDKDLTITQLKQRIAVLEKIVTEPAYELNKKINQL